MSDLVTWSLPQDFRARIKALLPGVTEADFAHLDRMCALDRVVTDDSTAHVQLVAWVAHVMDRGAGGALPLPVPVLPIPSKGPAGAEVMP